MIGGLKSSHLEPFPLSGSTTTPSTSLENFEPISIRSAGLFLVTGPLEPQGDDAMRIEGAGWPNHGFLRVSSIAAFFDVKKKIYTVSARRAAVTPSNSGFRFLFFSTPTSSGRGRMNRMNTVWPRRNNNTRRLFLSPPIRLSILSHRRRILALSSGRVDVVKQAIVLGFHAIAVLFVRQA